MSEGERSAPETLTHARLRAAQGDRAGARDVLRRVLARDPADAAARELLEALDDAAPGAGTPGREDRAKPGPAPTTSSDRDAPERRRRIRRLESWLARLERRG